MKATIGTMRELMNAQAKQEAEFRAHGYLRLSWTAEKDRTLPQNALSHAWYEQISRALQQDTPAQVKAECKLRFGVPILRRDDPDFRSMYDAQIKPLPYEVKLTLMLWVPVTSLMGTGQLSEYLETVQAAYRGSVALEFPEQERWAA